MAIEHARGLGCHLTQWLLAHGETVQDVPTTATARVRELSRGRGRKTDALDAAAAAAVAALRGAARAHCRWRPRKLRADRAAALLRAVHPLTAADRARKQVAWELVAAVRGWIGGWP